MAPASGNLGTDAVNDPPAPADAVAPSGSGLAPYTPALVVEEVAGAPFGLFAARVTMPDKSKVVVYLNRAAVANNTVELSIRAAGTIWGAYPGHQARGG